MSREEFLGLLVAASGGVKAAYRDLIDEWRPEEPPVTTLFAALGERIANDFSNVGVDSNHRMFSLIETAMESSDQELVTAVATGLIEALERFPIERIRSIDQNSLK